MKEMVLVSNLARSNPSVAKKHKTVLRYQIGKDDKMNSDVCLMRK